MGSFSNDGRGYQPQETADRGPIPRGLRSVADGSISSHEAFADIPDERASSLLVFEDDVQMISTASQNAHEDIHLKITGTEGRIELRPAFHGECSLHLSRGDLSVTVEHDSFDAEHEMEAAIDYFADRLLGDGEIDPGGRHGLRDRRVIEALHDSAERGEPVALA